jgi:hypothetical protein
MVWMSAMPIPTAREVAAAHWDIAIAQGKTPDQAYKEGVAAGNAQQRYITTGKDPSQPTKPKPTQTIVYDPCGAFQGASRADYAACQYAKSPAGRLAASQGQSPDQKIQDVLNRASQAQAQIAQRQAQVAAASAASTQPAPLAPHVAEMQSYQQFLYCLPKNELATLKSQLETYLSSLTSQPASASRNVEMSNIRTKISYVNAQMQAPKPCPTGVTTSMGVSTSSSTASTSSGAATGPRCPKMMPKKCGADERRESYTTESGCPMSRCVPIDVVEPHPLTVAQDAVTGGEQTVASSAPADSFFDLPYLPPSNQVAVETALAPQRLPSSQVTAPAGAGVSAGSAFASPTAADLAPMAVSSAPAASAGVASDEGSSGPLTMSATAKAPTGGSSSAIWLIVGGVVLFALFAKRGKQ